MENETDFLTVQSTDRADVCNVKSNASGQDFKWIWETDLQKYFPDWRLDNVSTRNLRLTMKIKYSG